MKLRYLPAVMLLMIPLAAGCGPSPQARLAGQWKAPLPLGELLGGSVTMQLQADGNATIEFSLGNADEENGSLLDRGLGAMGVDAKLSRAEKGTWQVDSAQGDDITISITTEGKQPKQYRIVFVGKDEIDVSFPDRQGEVLRFTRAAAP